MKKSILLVLISIMSANALLLIDDAPISIKGLIQTQNRRENNLARIKPAGIWFTEEEELP